MEDIVSQEEAIMAKETMIVQDYADVRFHSEFFCDEKFKSHNYERQILKKANRGLHVFYEN